MKEYWRAYGSRARWRDTASRVFADFVTCCKRPTNKQRNILPISDVNKLELVPFLIYRSFYFSVATETLHWCLDPSIGTV